MFSYDSFMPPRLCEPQILPAGSLLAHPERWECLHGEHGESAVLDLLDLELGQGVWVISQAEGVEGASWVQGVKSLNSWALAVGTVSLSASHEDDLQKSNF